MARLRFPALPGSPFVRFALLLPLVTACIVGALFYPLYREAEGHIRDGVHAAIEQEILALDSHFHEGGLEALAAEINQRLASPIDPDAVYLLADAGGSPVAGNLEAWPGEVPVQDDVWFRVRDAQGRNLEGKVFLLFSDQRLLVGRRSPLAAFRQNMTLRLAGSAVLIVLATAVLAGVFMARLRRRVRELSDHARAIQEGNLSRRLPISRNDDELDQLAAGFNRAFAEIERLMEGMRHVSSALAHDMRRPLIALRNALESALGEASPGSALHGALSRLIEQTEGLLHTFASLLRLARLESGGLPPDIGPCPVHGVARDVVELYAAVAEQRQRQLTAALDPAWVRGDRELLFQLLVNLIENALVHGGGAIHLTVAPDGDWVRLRVGDQGRGVPAAALPRLFDRFYRVDPARSGSNGSGVGLALVRGIAEAHGGSVAAAHGDPGLVIEVRLPRVPGGDDGDMMTDG
jgi:signal transduction histidine kinase